MAKIDSLVQDFLAQKKIAVVGVSDKRETGCNGAYHRFKQADDIGSSDLLAAAECGCAFQAVSVVSCLAVMHGRGWHDLFLGRTA